MQVFTGADVSEVQRHALLRDIARRETLCSFDELRVIDRALRRLELGRARYGLLDLSKDRRDWRAERFEERLDALIYDIADELAAEDRVLGAWRDADRHELLREWRDTHETCLSNVPARLAMEDLADAADDDLEIEVIE